MIKIFPALFLISMFGCNSTTDSSNQDTLLLSKLTKDGVVFTLTITKNTFDLADTLKGAFNVSNQSDSLKRFNFANIQQLGFRLSDTSGKVFLYAPIIVSPALSGLILQSGESKDYVILSRFKNHDGDYIDRKEYKLTAYLLDNNSPAVALVITVR